MKISGGKPPFLTCEFSPRRLGFPRVLVLVADYENIAEKVRLVEFGFVAPLVEI